MDAQVQQVVNTIASAIEPERVILFGSRATGSAGPESDIDLLLVYSGPKTKREVQLSVHSLFKRPSFSLDVFVMRPEELEANKGIANTLAREVSERGVVCYGG